MNAKLKVPREKIPWYPTINYDACIHDRECIEFCKNDVFDWDEVLGVPIVARPNNCVVGCDACAKICPVGGDQLPAFGRIQSHASEADCRSPAASRAVSLHRGGPGGRALRNSWFQRR
jgi:NAD-dependent dihydropyrimidine dehydrogenase PreA subunit